MPEEISRELQSEVEDAISLACTPVGFLARVRDLDSKLEHDEMEEFARRCRAKQIPIDEILASLK